MHYCYIPKHQTIELRLQQVTQSQSDHLKIYLPTEYDHLVIQTYVKMLLVWFAL